MNPRFSSLLFISYFIGSASYDSWFQRDVIKTDVTERFVARPVRNLEEHAHAADLCMCNGTTVICNEMEDDLHNGTDTEVAEAREGEGEHGGHDLASLCICSDDEVLTCEEHHEDCHCDGDVVHCSDEALEADCHCHGSVVHCEEHMDERECHCDAGEVHCADEALEADCHCDGDEVHCEEHGETAPSDGASMHVVPFTAFASACVAAFL